MTEPQILGVLIAVLFAVVGVVWSNLRGELADIKAAKLSLERDVAQLQKDHARSDERDKTFEKGIDRLTKAIDDFDSRIGAQIERLSRIVEGQIRKPSGGEYKFKYIDPPKEDNDK